MLDDIKKTLWATGISRVQSEFTNAVIERIAATDTAP